MATIKTGCCPSCGKERELAFVKFGVIQATMCPYCLHKYLDSCYSILCLFFYIDHVNYSFHFTILLNIPITDIILRQIVPISAPNPIPINPVNMAYLTIVTAFSGKFIFFPTFLLIPLSVFRRSTQGMLLSQITGSLLFLTVPLFLPYRIIFPIDMK